MSALLVCQQGNDTHDFARDGRRHGANGLITKTNGNARSSLVSQNCYDLWLIKPVAFL